MHPGTLSLVVKGVEHGKKGEPARRFAIDLCRPGDPVQLLPEPKNPVDPRAVLVLNKEGMTMGYVAAERCGMVKRQIDDGAEVKAIFQAATERGAVIRVTFDGNDPDLPPDMGDEAELADFDSGFVPDWIPPDD